MKRTTSWDRVEYLKKICASYNAPKKQETWDVTQPIELPFEDGVQKAYPKAWDQKRIDLFEAGQTSTLLTPTKVDTPKKIKKTKETKEKKMGAALSRVISHAKTKV
jgi:hypothetical protein